MPMPSDSQEFTLSPFDQALIESGYLSLSQIHQALLESRRTGVALPTVVEAMVGESLPAELHRQYEAQQRFALTVIHGVTFFDQDQLTPLVDKAAIAQLISRYLPLPFCRQYGFLPLRHWEDSGSLLVVMVDPSDEEAYRFLERQLSPYQLLVQRRGIVREAYDDLLDQLYGDQDILKILMDTNDGNEGKRPPATVVDVTEVIEEIPPQIVALQSQPESAPSLSSPPPASNAQEDKQVVQLVNKILILGLRESANEIHLEPEENQLLVRIRQGGNLRLLMEPIPKDLAPAIVRRLKVMTNLDIHQTQLPQKGRLRKSYNSRPAYFFIHTSPSFYGEKVLVRIVPALETLPELKELCGNRPTQNQLQGLAQMGSGLVVIAGPAYGGKSTTLEAFLGQQLKQNLAIGSVEDPIRHTHPGITQVEVNLEQGLTGAKAIAALADQRLDVIAVDGLDSAETAQAVVTALNQGRMVFVTLIAKDAATAIAQLQQWLPPAVLGEYLRGVVAQRLIRCVCPSCRLKTTVTPEQQQRFGLPGGTLIYQANSLSAEVMQQAGVKQRLCQQCHGFGYAGVRGVFEVVPMITPLQQIIRRPCPTADLRLAFQQTGMTSLAQAAIALVGEGVTSLEEVHRVLPKLPDHLPPAPLMATQSSSAPLPSDFPARLQRLEQCVVQLNQSLADLKQAIAPQLEPPQPAVAPPISPPTPTVAPPVSTPKPPVAPALDLLPELEALENLSAQKRSKKDQTVDMDEESTLIRDFADIEELLVDNDLPELDPKDATLVGEIEFPQGDDHDPFKTAMDPW